MDDTQETTASVNAEFGEKVDKTTDALEDEVTSTPADAAEDTQETTSSDINVVYPSDQDTTTPATVDEDLPVIEVVEDDPTLTTTTVSGVDETTASGATEVDTSSEEVKEMTTLETVTTEEPA